MSRPAGPLLTALLRTLELIAARLDTTPVNLPGGQQLQLADLPEVVIREALAAAWRSVRADMDGILRRLRWESTEHMEVTEKADRVRSLSMHLDFAVELAGQLRYPPALVLIRTGLEHCAVDRLVFLGRTLTQRFAHIDDATWSEWQSARAAGEDWTRTIRDWTRTRRGEVRVVREGMFSEPDEVGNRSQISVYFFLLEQYRPTIGPPSSQRGTRAISNPDLRAMPAEPRPEDVPYPTDPLQRLVALHSHAHEMLTGLQYVSPATAWSRAADRLP